MMHSLGTWAPRLWLALLVLGGLVACADPKYAPEQEFGTNPSGDSGQERKLEICDANFASGQCVSYSWETKPTEENYGSFVFRILGPAAADGTRALIDPEGAVAVVLWMSSMGHGSTPVTVERLDRGTYRASKVFFTMRGEWDIRFQLKDGRDVKDQAIVTISL